MSFNIKTMIPAKPQEWICEVYRISTSENIDSWAVHMWAVVEDEGYDHIEPVVLSASHYMSPVSWCIDTEMDDSGDMDYRLRRVTQTEKDLGELFG